MSVYQERNLTALSMAFTVRTFRPFLTFRIDGSRRDYQHRWNDFKNVQLTMWRESEEISLNKMSTELGILQ